MSLCFNTLSRFVITFMARSNHLLIPFPRMYILYSPLNDIQAPAGLLTFSLCETPIPMGIVSEKMMSREPNGASQVMNWERISLPMQQTQGSIPGLGRSPGIGNGNPLQYPCMGYHMNRGALWATVHRVTKSRTQLSKIRREPDRDRRPSSQLQIVLISAKDSDISAHLALPGK